MSKLDSNALEVKYNDPSTGLFKDNTSKDITPSRMRTFVTDLTDSIPFFLDGFPLIFCGNADLSSDLFPTTGGTGAAGAIKAGNVFRVSVATTSGVSGGYPIDANSEIRALVDSPGQTLANWWIRI